MKTRRAIALVLIFGIFIAMVVGSGSAAEAAIFNLPRTPPVITDDDTIAPFRESRSRWQAMDPREREKEIARIETLMGLPPSRVKLFRSLP
jgi:hypothetical protein